MAPRQRTIRLSSSRTRAKSENGCDFFSSLPEVLLTTILSLLPIKEAARTSVLSSSWCHLWKSVPLCLDDSSLHLDHPDLDDSSHETAYKIIQAHMGPIEYCNLSTFDDLALFSTINSLLQQLSEKKIKHLSLSFNETWRILRVYHISFIEPGEGYRLASRAYKVPSSFLQCETLKQLDLFCCRVSKNIDHANVLPNVKEINLECVFLKDVIMERLFSCPNLEKVKMHHCCGPKRVQIRSRKLRELVIAYATHSPFVFVEEIFIDDAPSLEVLMIKDTADNYITRKMKMKIPTALNLVQLGLYCYLGDTRFVHGDNDCLVSSSLSALLPSLKALSIRLAFCGENQQSLLASFLRDSPVLEYLHLENIHQHKLVLSEIVHNTRNALNFWNLHQLDFLEHLQKFIICGIRGCEPELDLICILIKRAVVLQKIDIFYRGTHMYDFLMNAGLKICSTVQASNDLLIGIGKDTDVHDMFAYWE